MNQQHIHLIGIGGTGMGPLAKIFLEMGHIVSGSDLKSSDTTEYLQKLGAKVYFRHEPENITGANQIVYSSAIPSENPEIIAGKKQGIRIVHRSEVLAHLLNRKRGIAVAGAHGKTTVTSMIGLCMEKAGFDPSVLIGAHFTPFGPGAKYGNGDFVIAEADESDRSFLRYKPELGIVTGIEADHLENYDGTFSKLISSYKQFLENCAPAGQRVLGIDSPIVRELGQDYNAITYGFSHDATWRAEIVQLAETSSVFRAFYQGQPVGEFSLKVPGRHNVANALACIASGHYAGMSLANLQSGLAAFTGVHRRFQIVGERQGILIVDDYAHHPTEIAATINAAQEGWNRRIVAVFQPHRFSRTQFFLSEFVDALHDADLTVLTDIYAPPPENPIPGISSATIAEGLRERGANVSLVPRQEELSAFLHKSVQENDLVLVMGAGPIWQVAHELYELLGK